MNTNPSGPNPELDAYLNHHAQQADWDGVLWWRIGIYPHNWQLATLHVRLAEPNPNVDDDPGVWTTLFFQHHNAVKLAAALLFYAEYLKVLESVDFEKARKDTWDLLGQDMNERVKEHVDAYRKAHPELD